MKKNILLFILMLSAIYCFSQEINKTKIIVGHTSLPDTSLHAFRFISKADAELVLEQPSFLKDSAWSFEGEIWKFKCTYLTSKKDTITKQSARLFYAFENYKQLSEAKRFFDLMKKENEKTSQVNITEQIGDESFLSKDILNNPFLMIRKNNKIFKFKVYQVNSPTSLKQLISLSQKIVAGQ